MSLIDYKTEQNKQENSEIAETKHSFVTNLRNLCILDQHKNPVEQKEHQEVLKHTHTNKNQEPFIT